MSSVKRRRSWVAGIAAVGVLLVGAAPAVQATTRDRVSVGGRSAEARRATGWDFYESAETVVRDNIKLRRVRTEVSGRPVTGKGATKSDFDGDGRDDLAVGTNDGNSGIVVTYSSLPVRDHLNTEYVDEGGTSGSFGSTLAAGNFNGDRYDDLAVDDYYEADWDNKGVESGGVWVLLGGPDGLRFDEPRHFNQSTSGIAGVANGHNWFGSALAAGDITGDGYDELLIGTPFQTVSGKKEAGSVVVLKGTNEGLVTAYSQYISQSTAGVPGKAAQCNNFGMSLDIGNINNDKYQDVVIAAPMEDECNPKGGSGSVTQFWGSKSGVSLKKVTRVTGRSTKGLKASKGIWLDRLGDSVKIANTTGSGYGEVITAAPFAQTTKTGYSGAVVSLTVRKSGISTKGMIVLSQADKAVAGSAESSAFFGYSIDTGDITGDRIADVLVGVPGKKIGKNAEAGLVVLLRGSSKGLTGAKSQTLSQATAGVPDSPERGDKFGQAVVVLNLDGNTRLDAVVSAPNEAVGSEGTDFRSGSVTKLYGGSKGLLGKGVRITGPQLALPNSGLGWQLVS
jgi:hypothetical protein